MSDYHFGIDYDMWLYPPVPWWEPDCDFDLPEPIEAANIEGTLLVNAEDAIEQVRRLQDEDAKLRELCADLYAEMITYSSAPHYNASVWAPKLRELRVEVP